MADKKTVKALFTDDGNFHLDFSGFEGQGCYAEAKAIEEELAALGIETRPKERKPKIPEPPREAGSNAATGRRRVQS